MRFKHGFAISFLILTTRYYVLGTVDYFIRPACLTIIICLITQPTIGKKQITLFTESGTNEYLTVYVKKPWVLYDKPNW